MNKILLFLIMLGISHVQAMEQAGETTSFKDLPYELLAHIGSRSTTLAEGLKNIYGLAKVDTSLQRIINNPSTINAFAMSYIKDHLEKAKDEFIELIQSLEFNRDPEEVTSKLKLIKIFLDGGIDLNSNYVLRQSSHVPLFEGRERKTTPLMEAVETRNKELIKLLIDHGANVNMIAEGDTRGTPLARVIYLLAVNRGPRFVLTKDRQNMIEIVQLLVDAGANPHLSGKMPAPWQSAMALANHLDHTYREEILNIFTKYDSGAEPK